MGVYEAAFDAPIELELDDVPFLVLYIEFFYLLGPLILSSVASEDVKAVFPLHGVAGAPPDI